MEKEDCSPYDIGALILSLTNIDTSAYNNNIFHSINRLKTQFGIKSTSTLLPIAQKPSFILSTLDSGYIHWKDLGIRNVGELYVGSDFASYSQRQVKFGLYIHNHFRYYRSGHMSKNICIL